jgi:hypothetical protein
VTIRATVTGCATCGEFEETALRSYTIDHQFNRPAKAVVTLADPTGVLMRKYNVNTVDLAGAVADDGGVETDETTEANEDTADDMTIFPLVAVANDAYYFGFAGQVPGFTLSISTAGVSANATVDWEYSQGADAWASLAGGTQGDFNVFGDFTVAEHDISWTVPGDWATDEVGSISGKYWVRVRVTFVPGGQTSPLGKQAWTSAVYLGPGKVTIEDPNATDIFYGRIVKAQGSFQEKKLYLTCEDWLSQLDEEHITYDMREDLDNSGLRQSTLAAVPDYDIYPAYTDGTPKQWLFDDNMGAYWAIDEWNDMKLMFTAGTAGTVKSSVGPYLIMGDEDTMAGAGSHANLWENDLLSDVWLEDAVAFDDYNADLFFRTFGTADADNLFVAESIKSAKFTLEYTQASASGAVAVFQIHDHSAGPAFVTIAEFPDSNTRRRITINVPEDYLADGKLVDTSGVANCRIAVTGVDDTTTTVIWYANLEIEFNAIGTSQLFTIVDTVRGMDDGDGATYNTLQVTGATVGVAGLNLWQDAPYCIMRPIYKHIASDETPGTLITGGDVLVTLTCAATIEHTTGYSSRQYKETTRLRILQDLAAQDKAVFWITLGGTTVTYKQTFGADTMQLTDGMIDDWQSIYDYKQMFNEYHVYGARIGDGEVYVSSADAASKTKFIATRSKVLRNAGLVSDAHASAVGTALAARDADVLQMVGCTIPGNTATAAHATTIKLGEIVEITSSYLWGTAAKDYVVTRFAYDSSQHKTYLTLHPKSSIGYQEIDALYSKGQKMEEDTDKLKTESYVADPVTHDVS